MSVVDEVSQANESYASGFAKGDLPMPPGRRFAVVTCMDARLDPAGFLGLEAKLGPESESIDFQPFPDVAERVRQSVETIRNHPLLADGFGASGFVYDVESGRIEPV